MRNKELFNKTYEELIKVANDYFLKEAEKLKDNLYLWIKLLVNNRWKLPDPQYDENGRELPRPHYILEPEEYLASISTSLETSTKGPQVVVSVEDGKHDPSGMTWKMLHLLREFGSDSLKLPPAPMWRVLKAKLAAQLPMFRLQLLEDFERL